jgi:hypothetical protein
MICLLCCWPACDQSMWASRRSVRRKGDHDDDASPRRNLRFNRLYRNMPACRPGPRPPSGRGRPVAPMSPRFCIDREHFNTVLGAIGFNEKGDFIGPVDWVWNRWRDGAYSPHRNDVASPRRHLGDADRAVAAARGDRGKVIGRNDHRETHVQTAAHLQAGAGEAL